VYSFLILWPVNLLLLTRRPCFSFLLSIVVLVVFICSVSCLSQYCTVQLYCAVNAAVCLAIRYQRWCVGGRYCVKCSGRLYCRPGVLPSDNYVWTRTSRRCDQPSTVATADSDHVDWSAGLTYRLIPWCYTPVLR